MSEAIIEIKEVHNESYDVYNIITNKQTIEVGVSNGQSCCERFGYMSSDDNLVYYISSELYEIEVVDPNLSVTSVPELYEGGAMFVNFRTSLGVFQLAVYNSQNGYYGHEAFVRSNAINHSERI